MLGLERVNVLPRKPVWLMHVSTQKNYNLQIKKLWFIIDFINKKLCYSQTPTYPPTSLRTH